MVRFVVGKNIFKTKLHALTKRHASPHEHAGDQDTVFPRIAQERRISSRDADTKKKLIVMIFFFFRDVTRAVTRGRRLTMEEEWDEFVDEVVQVRNLRTRPGCPDPRTALTMGVCADWRA